MRLFPNRIGYHSSGTTVRTRTSILRFWRPPCYQLHHVRIGSRIDCHADPLSGFGLFRTNRRKGDSAGITVPHSNSLGPLRLAYQAFAPSSIRSRALMKAQVHDSLTTAFRDLIGPSPFLRSPWRRNITYGTGHPYFTCRHLAIVNGNARPGQPVLVAVKGFEPMTSWL